MMVRSVLASALVVLMLSACGATSAPPSSIAATSSPNAPTIAPATTPSSSSAASTAVDNWRLVAVGDSIPYNSSDDCPGCRGFVDRYVDAIRDATDHAIDVQNLSQHNGLQVDGLLAELADGTLRRKALADADIIVVGIAHNDTPMNRDDDPCDGAAGDNPDWSKYDAACIAAAVAAFAPKYDAVFRQIQALREGKPTIFRAINRYNDWNGWPGHDLSPAGVTATNLVVRAWSDMICKAAVANGFLCADINTRFNGADGLTPSGDLLAADYTHPSDKGNEVIADALIDLGYAPLAP